MDRPPGIITFPWEIERSEVNPGGGSEVDPGVVQS